MLKLKRAYNTEVYISPQEVVAIKESVLDPNNSLVSLRNGDKIGVKGTPSEVYDIIRQNRDYKI